MKERGIIFSGDMVKALQAGTKTQTRRIMKPQPNAEHEKVAECYSLDENEIGYEIRCPYGVAGDRLKVTETFAMRSDIDWRKEPSRALHYCHYKADGGFDPRDEMNWHHLGRWRSPRFMPHCLSRITLEILKVRVERLQDISEADCREEGINLVNELYPNVNPQDKLRQRYRLLWDSLHGTGSWALNPWIWILEFKKL